MQLTSSHLHRWKIKRNTKKYEIRKKKHWRQWKCLIIFVASTLPLSLIFFVYLSLFIFVWFSLFDYLSLNNFVVPTLPLSFIFFLSLMIIFVASTLPLSGQQWQWFVGPLLHFWEIWQYIRSATPSDFSSEKIFARRKLLLVICKPLDFCAWKIGQNIPLEIFLAKIFLRGKLVKALISSSEDNQRTE